MNLSLEAIPRWLLLHKRLAIVGAVVAAGAIALLAYSGGDDTQYITARIARGDIHDVVEANGTVSAVTTVLVGSQVSGTIAKLYANFNSRVHKGQVIALIDPALFQGALDQALANLHAAEAQLEKDEASLAYADVNYRRNAELAKENAIAINTADNAKNVYDQALAQISVDQAGIGQNEAAVNVARTNLAYTTIRSPVEGVVVARNVDVGQTVEASLQAPTIFTIAQDLTKMQVYVKTDESDEGRIRVGARVTFKVDAFPKEVFAGVVSQKRMNATAVQNVVTYDTIVDFDNPGERLFPGMTAFVTVPVAEATNALEIANTALRFTPPLQPEKIRSLYAQFGIAANASENAGSSASTSGHHESAIVWKVGNKGALEPVKIEIGITDHAYTQILGVDAGTLAEGDEVATASIAKASARP